MRPKPSKKETVVTAVLVCLCFGLAIWFTPPASHPFEWGRPVPGNLGEFENLWGELPTSAGGVVLDEDSLTQTTYDHAFTAMYLDAGSPAFHVEYSLSWYTYRLNVREWSSEEVHGDVTCGRQESGREACMMVGMTGVLVVSAQGDQERDATVAFTNDLAAQLLSTADPDTPWGGYRPTRLETAKSLRSSLPHKVEGIAGKHVDPAPSTATIREYDLGIGVLRLVLDENWDDYIRWIMVMEEPTRFGDVVCDAKQPVRCVTVGANATLGLRFYGRISPEEGARLLELAYDEM